jgi:cellulose synthase/poly-beta-1,6-N-acetylglucosamine synthase-like glycosyltransferase
VNHYLSNYRFRNRLFDTPPHPETGIIVVIPCHKEEKLIGSLNSLLLCQKTKGKVEVIVIVNSAENTAEIALAQNRRTMEQTTKWIAENQSDFIRFMIHNEEDLPRKHAGVGLARKIGMDEAVDRFEQIGNANGVIVCFDADSLCDKNYLIEIEKAFTQNSKATGASIYFEHPLKGEEFEVEIYEGILLYELFLRYYRQAFKFTNHPKA